VDSEAGEAEADCCTVISEHRATLRLLASVWVGLLLLLLLRGGKGLPSLLGFPTCGAAYWALTALAVGGLALCSVLAGRSLVGRSRALSGMNHSEGDVRWSPRLRSRVLFSIPSFARERAHSAGFDRSAVVLARFVSLVSGALITHSPCSLPVGLRPSRRTPGRTGTIHHGRATDIRHQ